MKCLSFCVFAFVLRGESLVRSDAVECHHDSDVMSHAMDVLRQKNLHSFSFKVMVANINSKKQKPHNVWINI